MFVVKSAAAVAIVVASMSLPGSSMAQGSGDKAASAHKKVYYNYTAPKPAGVNRPVPATPTPSFLNDHTSDGGVG